MTFWTQSIRARLTFWYTLLVLSSLLLFGGLSYYFTGRTLSENLDLLSPGVDPRSDRCRHHEDRDYHGQQTKSPHREAPDQADSG